jgi:hypothetical protein
MKIRITFFAIIIFICSTGFFAQGVIDQIKIDTLNRYVRDLSGDKTFRLNGVPWVIKTRNTTYSSSDVNTAAMYIKSKFEYFGLTAYEQSFTLNAGGTVAKNVIAVQTGSQYPNKKYIICAHYDDMPSAGGVAPGADDNASGTAAVLEAARVISTLSPKYTIVYALWSGEEQGLLGSYYYAGLAKDNNEDIMGVINLDMIAWDEDGNNSVRIESKSITPEKQPLLKELLDMFTTANQLYNINMTLSKISSTAAYSDHYPFLENDFPAILMIEESNDFNKYYHTVNDTYAHMYITYFEKCSKLAICTLAELAQTNNALDIEDKKAISTDFTLSQNYPNPFNPTTVISYRLANSGYVSLRVFDALGREVKALVDEYQPAGEHSANFTISNQSITSGVYFYKLQSGNQFLTKKMVYLK